MSQTIAFYFSAQLEQVTISLPLLSYYCESFSMCVEIKSSNIEDTQRKPQTPSSPASERAYDHDYGYSHCNQIIYLCGRGRYFESY